MMRKFSFTSANDIFLEMEKNGGEFFEFKVGPTLVKMTWVQLEMLKMGSGDMSDAHLEEEKKTQ